MHFFSDETADAVWLEAARSFAARDGTLVQSSRAGETLELLHCGLTINNPRERWVVSRQPAMNPAFALAEVVWILNGRNDSKLLNFWNPKLPQFQGSGDTYHGAYGFRLRRQFGLDQIRLAYETLKANADSRQVVLQIWDARADLPIENGEPRDQDVPCNVCAVLKVRNGKLDWLQVMRSNDLILGLPHNLIQFTSLQEMMAAWLGCELGTYSHISDSLHVYQRDFGSLTSLSAASLPPNDDRWTLDFEQSLEVLDTVSKRMDIMRDASARESETRRAATDGAFPVEVRNLLVIIGADAARRHAYHTLASELAGECSNPALRKMWERWQLRTEDRHPREPARLGS
jgi:thymidylate synthase